MTASPALCGGDEPFRMLHADAQLLCRVHLTGSYPLGGYDCVMYDSMHLFEHLQSFAPQLYSRTALRLQNSRLPHTHSRGPPMLVHRSLVNCDASSPSCCSLPAALPRLQPQLHRAAYRWSCRASLDPRHVSLTRAQQRCLSVDRRRSSDPAPANLNQPSTADAADAQEVLQAVLKASSPQHGSAAVVEPLQAVKVRQDLLQAHAWLHSCLPQPPAVCRRHVLARSFTPSGSMLRCMCSHAAAGRQAVPRLRCGI